MERIIISYLKLTLGLVPRLRNRLLAGKAVRFLLGIALRDFQRLHLKNFLSGGLLDGQSGAGFRRRPAASDCPGFAEGAVREARLGGRYDGEAFRVVARLIRVKVAFWASSRHPRIENGISMPVV